MKQINRLLKLLLAFIPTALPVGRAGFDAWADSIIFITGEYADKDSMKWAMASMIQHAGSTRGYIPKMFFILSLRKAAANQIAAQVFQDIKLKQEEAKKAADEAAKQAEATAPPAVVDETKT